jgi:hypothetical protein
MSEDSAENSPSRASAQASSQAAISLQTQDGHPTIIRLDPHGRAILIDLVTGGETLLEDGIQGPVPVDNMIQLKDDTGRAVWVQRGLTLEDTFKATGRRQYPYSPFLVDLICRRIAEGETITSICREPGMPSYNTICKWRREHDEFSKAYLRARNDRAEIFFDKAIEVVENADPQRDQVALAKVKSDVYRYAAKVSNPTDFGETTKVSGTIGVAQIHIETGVRRAMDEGFIDVSDEISDSSHEDLKEE